MAFLKDKKILLIITGSIAAYKSLDLIRLIRKEGGDVTCVTTKAAEQFVTRMSVAAISGNPEYDDVFSLQDEVEMGHIRLSRESDLVVVAPASADIIGKMSCGLANDLASTILLATDKQVMVAPAMNVKMWENKAIKRNVSQLKDDGVLFVGPGEGELACGEVGEGRMSEPEEILDAIRRFFE